MEDSTLLKLSFGSAWDSLRSSLWFVPSLLVVAAISLAVLLVTSEAYIDTSGLRTNWPRLFGAGAEGSRGMLSAIATSMVTIAGVAFSITIVALSLASSQYTSRILRNFMRDRANQLVLGVLVGIYVYCLIVLRTIRSGEEGAFVPSLAILFAVVLALVGIGCFIFFIHHIAQSIQAESIIKSAAEETAHAIDRLYPTDIGSSREEEAEEIDQPVYNPFESPDSYGTNRKNILSPRSGYLQVIDAEHILQIACDHENVIRIERIVGEFVVEGDVLATVHCGHDTPDSLPDKINSIADVFTIGSQRTTVQDAAFGIRQIVDIALKALSSGVNDTTTAVTCVHHLTAILARLASRKFESPYRFSEGKLRVIAPRNSFADLTGAVFSQIRQNASGNVAVMMAQLQSAETVAQRAREQSRKEPLLNEVRMIESLARATLVEPHDLNLVLERVSKTLRNIEQEDAQCAIAK